jgi:hypothetical protein
VLSVVLDLTKFPIRFSVVLATYTAALMGCISAILLMMG